MKLTSSRAVALIAATMLGLGAAATLPAMAMQNIKCVKAGAGEQMTAWAGAAGGLLKSFDGAEAISAEKLSEPLAGLMKQGAELGGVCKTCGAEKAAARVIDLTETLKRVTPGDGEIEAGSEEWKALTGTLKEIAGLTEEFEL